MWKDATMLQVPRPLAPSPTPNSSNKGSCALLELLVVNGVTLWVCLVLALDHRGGTTAAPMRLEAMLLTMLSLAAHAGLGPSQLRFAPDSGVAVGLTAVPCVLASLFLVSDRNPMLASLFRASLMCSGSVAVRHLLCFPVSDIPLQSSYGTRMTSAASKLCVLALRVLLPWPDRTLSVLALGVHELCLWGLTDMPLFTASFTLGEACILIQALALAVADAICCAAEQAHVLVSDPSMPRTGRDPVVVVLQYGLLLALASGAVILPLFCVDISERRDAHGVLQKHTDATHRHTHAHSDVSAAGNSHGSNNNSINTPTTTTTTNTSGSSEGGPPSTHTSTAGGSNGRNGQHHMESSSSSSHNGPDTTTSPSTKATTTNTRMLGEGLLAMLGFIAVMCVYIGVVLLPVIGYMIGQNPLGWVLEFLYEDSGRVKLCVYWCVLLLVFTQAIVPLSSALSLRRIMVRKLFHILAAVMFFPATLRQPRFLALAYAVALSALTVLEYIRMSRKTLPLGAVIHRYYLHFLDERDMGNLVVTHLYLLLGCAAPLWLSWLPTADGTGSKGGRGEGSASVLIPYAGIVALGVGDAAAATIGTLFGRHRWPGSRRTLEGSAAMVVCVLISVAAVEQAVGVKVMTSGVTEVGGCILASLLLSLLEAFTSQIDNLVLPAFAVTLLNMAGRFSSDCRLR